METNQSALLFAHTLHIILYPKNGISTEPLIPNFPFDDRMTALELFTHPFLAIPATVLLNLI